MRSPGWSGEEATLMSFTIDDVVEAARNGFHTTVGLGAIAYQRAQVQRQAAIHQLPRLFHELQTTVDDHVRTVGERLRDADERAEEIFDGIEQRLPAPVRGAARQVHAFARDVRAQIGTPHSPT
jgi:hypothetical protein